MGTTLGQGILLNQPAPRLHRANRRPLYLAIFAVIAVVVLVIWAWVARTNMKSIAAAKAASNPSATPATSALKSLDKQWADKDPSKASALKPGMPEPITLQPISAPPLRPFPMAPMPTMPVIPQAVEAAVLAPALAPRGPVDEQHAAWESPMVAARQTLGGMDSPVVTQGMPQIAPGALPGVSVHGRESQGVGDDMLNQNLQESKKAFAGAGESKSGAILAGEGQLLKYVVQAGWDIPAILEQAANSDLPGELRARARENVYDTATGKFLLIPQNSILVGKYNSDIAYGQNRVQVNWDRLQRPGNEPTIFLNNMNGQAADGQGGMSGHVNNHYKRLIGFAILSSAFAAGIQVSQNRGGTSSYGYPSTGETAGAAVGQQLGQFGQQITNRNLNRPPTIQILPGTRFNVRVDRDIVFVAPYKQP